MVFSLNNRLLQKTNRNEGKYRGIFWSIKVRDYVVPSSEEVVSLSLPQEAALNWKPWVRETAREKAGAITNRWWELDLNTEAFSFMPSLTPEKSWTRKSSWNKWKMLWDWGHNICKHFIWEDQNSPTGNSIPLFSSQIPHENDEVRGLQSPHHTGSYTGTKTQWAFMK
jgi:hypothetical protein